MGATSLLEHQINPIAFSIGSFSVHWYGLMYLVGFTLFYILGSIRCKQPHIASQGWVRKDIEDLLFYGVFAVILGARLGYIVFYKLGYYLEHPLEIFAVWNGGMSFHGGFIGVVVVSVVFAIKHKRNWLDITDLVAPCIPTGLLFGRLGNFINGELPGRITDADVSWIMIFPKYGSLPRHPSQLYEALLEGLVLFVILWIYARKPRARGKVSALFLGGYGLARFVVEYFREPDDFLGLQALDLSRGQWLCVPMILGGILLYLWSSRTEKKK